MRPISQHLQSLVVYGSSAPVEGQLPADEFPGGVVVHGDGEAGGRVAVEVRRGQLPLRPEGPPYGVGPGPVGVLGYWEDV